MTYSWLKFLHIVGVFAFLIAHGVSVAVAFKLRKERDRAKIQLLVELSGSTVVLMYVSLAFLTGFGVWTAMNGRMWGQTWIWESIGLLAFIIIAMIAMARPYYKRLVEKTKFRASGAPMASDEELAQILMSPIPLVLAGIGFVGLAGITYLMIFKPQ